MNILFLGTGAADWPIEKPDSMIEFRRCSSVLIDDAFLIDPGPQVPEALVAYGKSAKNIRWIIHTHRHNDHYHEHTVEFLQQNGAEHHLFTANEVKQIGDYKVSAYRGNHATSAETLHYIIEDGHSSLFYGLDGAWLTYEEVAGIREKCPDLAVLDATIGHVDGDYRIFEHNNLNMVLEMQKTLAPFVKQFCISHMARTLHTDQKTLTEMMAKHHILTAYDGMELEI